MPEMTKELEFLVVSVHEGRELPPVDAALTSSFVGIDAYIQCRFGNNPPVASKTRTKRDARANVTTGFRIKWDAEMWLPVWVPNKTNTILLSLWDRDLISKDDIVASFPPFRFDHVRASPAFFGARWVNLYGAPTMAALGRAAFGPQCA